MMLADLHMLHAHDLRHTPRAQVYLLECYAAIKASSLGGQVIGARIMQGQAHARGCILSCQHLTQNLLCTLDKLSALIRTLKG
jgi:hypothetical protein